MIRRLFLSGGAATLTASCAGLSESQLRERWPPIGEIVEVDGLPVHVWQRGQGRPVVLIHGASGNLRDWTFALAPHLAQSYRVIAFDRPGLGYSARLPGRGWIPAEQARHLAKATRQLGVRTPVLVGHSWGAALAMAWGVNDPDSLAGIVTLGGATMPWGGNLAFYYSLAASDITGGVVSHLVHALAGEAAITSALEEIFTPQAAPEGYAEYVGGPLATRPATVRYNARDLTRLDAALTEQSCSYPALELPVEILHGTADDVVRHEIHAGPMHDRLPNSRLTLLDGIGHMPQHAAPDAVEAAINRLLPA